MDHSEAIRISAAERYLLDELTPELRDDFEEHFFGCVECANDVTAAATFLESAKQELRKPVPVGAARGAVERPKPQSRRWSTWLRPAFLVPALAVLLAVVGYQNLVTYPKLRQQAALSNTVEVLPSISLINTATRGGEVPVINTASGQPFLVFLDIPATEHFSGYLCQLYSPAGKPQWTFEVNGEQSKDTLSLRIPSQGLPSGQYTLVVHGLSTGTNPDQAPEIGRFPFQLQAQK